MVLEYFNIVFGFAVVMLLFSLVITVMVQIVVVVGGLRSPFLVQCPSYFDVSASDHGRQDRSIEI